MRFSRRKNAGAAEPVLGSSSSSSRRSYLADGLQSCCSVEGRRSTSATAPPRRPRCSILHWLSLLLGIGLAAFPRAAGASSSSAPAGRDAGAAGSGACACPEASAPAMPVQKRKSLARIFAEAGTDKLHQHGYHRYYERELALYRDKPGLRLLEIGVGSGSSMQAWLEYFADPAAIQGVDVGYRDAALREETLAKVCRVRPEKCGALRIFGGVDQTKRADLRRLLAEEPMGWDIVVDDGVHVPVVQVITFIHLFPFLRPGGLYVVEDLATSYADCGYISGWPLAGGVGKRHPGNAVEKFKDLVDVVMRSEFKHPNYTVLGSDVDGDIVRISFGAGLLFVEKRPSDADWHREYPPSGIGEPWQEVYYEWSVHRRQQELRKEEPFMMD